MPLTTIGALAAPLTLGATEDEVKLIALCAIVVLIIALAVLHTVKKTTDVREREKTRREIAAYVAEGSITPQDAARLLSVGLTEQVAAELAKGVTWGTISANKARQVAEAFNPPQQAWGPPPPAPQAPPHQG